MEQNKTKYSCILVDDDVWALKDIRAVLPFHQLGFTIKAEFTSAEEALRSVSSLKPDLIVSDVCLGGMNGLELIAQCRNNGFCGECIIISGYSEFEYAQKAIEQDVCAYLIKPLNLAKGREALSKAYQRLEGNSSFSAELSTFDQILEYIRLHYQEKLSLDEVAEAFFINRTYLSELFSTHCQKTFVQYKNEVRIEHARLLLKNSKLPISEIASQCGFDNCSYFALVFKQFTGLSPVQFRNQ